MVSTKIYWFQMEMASELISADQLEWPIIYSPAIVTTTNNSIGQGIILQKKTFFWIFKKQLAFFYNFSSAASNFNIHMIELMYNV